MVSAIESGLIQTDTPSETCLGAAVITMYLPTIDHPLWPWLVVLVILVPVSVWHERHWRLTIAKYARLRREAGADDTEWPDRELRWMLGVQPGLIALAATMLGAMVVVGGVALLSWPHRVPGFDEVINYFDRPYLAAALVAGTAAVIGAAALSADLWRSPWLGVARNMRRAVHAPAEKRAAYLSAALECDPGIRP